MVVASPPLHSPLDVFPGIPMGGIDPLSQLLDVIRVVDGRGGHLRGQPKQVVQGNGRVTPEQDLVGRQPGGC